MATEKAVITQSHLTDIANAIIAKGGSTGPLKPSEMKAAIESIPSGEPKDPLQWTKYLRVPPSWPNIPKIYEETEAFGKMVILFSVEIGNTIKIPYCSSNSQFPIRVEFGDGTVYEGKGDLGSHTFDVADQSKYYAVITSEGTILPLTINLSFCLAIVGNKGIRPYVFWNTPMLVYFKASLDVSGNKISFYNMTELVDAELPEGVESFELVSSQYLYRASKLRRVPKISSVNAAVLSSQFLTDLREFPDEFNTGGRIDSHWTTTFSQSKYLERLPQYLCVNVSMSFAACVNVEKDSVAKFDESGNIIGGFVKTLRSWDTTNNSFLEFNPVDGQTITLASALKSLFTSEEQLAIETMFTSKNWTLAW